MREFPKTHAPPVIRIDFSSEQAWAELKGKITRPTAEGFEAQVAFIEDRALEGLDERGLAERIPRIYPHGYEHPVVFIVDRMSINALDNPLLVISTVEGSEPSFRCLPSAVQAIQNNLSLSNMDFFEFAGATDDDGVFRGFT